MYLFLYFKPISDSPDGFDVLWFGCVVFNFLPDFFDMYCDSCDVTDGFHIPDFAEEFIFGVHMVWVACQEGEQIEFLLL